MDRNVIEPGRRWFSLYFAEPARCMALDLCYPRKAARSRTTHSRRHEYILRISQFRLRTSKMWVARSSDRLRSKVRKPTLTPYSRSLPHQDDNIDGTWSVVTRKSRCPTRPSSTPESYGEWPPAASTYLSKSNMWPIDFRIALLV